ncbi:MAG: Xaa-Pro peptidase family protein [Acidobacteriota bacterium]
MLLSRRSFVRTSTVSLGALAASAGASGANRSQEDPLAGLKSMTEGVEPFALSDYEARVEKARRLMQEAGIDMLYLNGGTSMEYFGGIRWGLSERMFAMLIPARGEVSYICPKFEEGRAREQIRLGSDIRTWEEHESPYRAVKTLLADGKIPSGVIGIEPEVREFVSDGLRRECKPARFVNGESVSQGCRMIKTAEELRCMALANDITKKAYEAAFRTLREGTAPSELSGKIAEAHTRLGATGGASVSFGPASAFPHGSLEPRKLQPGDVVLVDGGCRVNGFRSDVTRTAVFGKAPDKVREVWGIVRQAQEAALAAARPGVTCEAVDAAARKVIVDAGYGPGYRYFTHRVGHGIGMDGHEYPYLVGGNKLPLQPGMTFSDEPGIYIVGEFGVRIEDDIYIAEDGAHFFGETVAYLQVL